MYKRASLRILTNSESDHLPLDLFIWIRPIEFLDIVGLQIA